MPLVETGIMTDIKLGRTDVQLVLQGSTVVWEREPVDYESEYLTFRNYGNDEGLFVFTTPTGLDLDIEISKNGGEWIPYSASTVSHRTASFGDSIRVKGTNDTYTEFNGNTEVGTSKMILSGATDYHVLGNIMSLIYGDNFYGERTLTYNNRSCFYDLLGGSYISRNDGLTNAEHLSLPATTLSHACYDNLLANTSIAVMPDLPATGLAEFCYLSMFSGCTNLVSVKELPATTLADVCYCNMFCGCTSLTSAPVLSAPVLVSMCYTGMFRGCTSLNYIKCLATNIPNISDTGDWLKNVSPTGTFVKSPNMSSWTTGEDGIPSGWTVVNAT